MLSCASCYCWHSGWGWECVTICLYVTRLLACLCSTKLILQRLGLLL